MNIQKLIAELRDERDCLDQIVLGLERLSRHRAPRRGRPPAWTKPVSVTAPNPENRLNGSTNGPVRLGASGK